MGWAFGKPIVFLLRSLDLRGHPGGRSDRFLPSAARKEQVLNT